MHKNEIGGDVEEKTGEGMRKTAEKAGYRKEVNGYPLDYFDGFRGVLFIDIGPLIGDPEAFRKCVDELAELYRSESIKSILMAEARGYIFGSALGYAMGVGLVQARKPGKLPGETIKYEYGTEYSKDCLEVQKGRIREGDRILVIDDLLATGGTTEAMIKLTEMSGGTVVGTAFIIELEGLGGRKRLENLGYKVYSVISQ